VRPAALTQQQQQQQQHQHQQPVQLLPVPQWPASLLQLQALLVQLQATSAC
jgi:hypothetical protein